MGEQLLSRIKEIVHEGNVRRILIKHEGNTILEIPLTFGIAGVLLAPVWAAIGVLGALLAQCSIEVVRSESPVEAAKAKVEEVSSEIPDIPVHECNHRGDIKAYHAVAAPKGARHCPYGLACVPHALHVTCLRTSYLQSGRDPPISTMAKGVGACY